MSDPLSKTSSWRARGEMKTLASSAVTTAHCLENSLENKDYKEVRVLWDELQDIVSEMDRILGVRNP